MTPKIKWPAHWDDSRCWPSQKGHLPDGRTWSAADKWLMDRGSSLHQFTVDMGKSTVWVPESELRLLIAGLQSFQEYLDLVKRLHVRAPTNQSGFKKVYGVTPMEMMRGPAHGQKPVVKEDTLRTRIQGMTVAQYDAVWRTWGEEYPHSSMFPKHFGKWFGELRDGARTPVAPLARMRKIIRGLSMKEYQSGRHELARKHGFRCPAAGEFPKVYQTTFMGVRDGKCRTGAGVGTWGDAL